MRRCEKDTITPASRASLLSTCLVMSPGVVLCCGNLLVLPLGLLCLIRKVTHHTDCVCQSAHCVIAAQLIIKQEGLLLSETSKLNAFSEGRPL